MCVTPTKRVASEQRHGSARTSLLTTKVALYDEDAPTGVFHSRPARQRGPWGTVMVPTIIAASAVGAASPTTVAARPRRPLRRCSAAVSRAPAALWHQRLRAVWIPHGSANAAVGVMTTLHVPLRV